MESQHRNDSANAAHDAEASPPEQVAHQEGEWPERAVTHGSAGRDSKAYKEIIEWIKALLIAVLLVFIIRQFLFSPYIVDGSSMEPNFQSGERLIVNKITYVFREPKFGEVVVFDVPDQGRKYIKRVIGVPGDTVRLEGDNLYINEELVEEPYIKEALEASRASGVTYNGGDARFNFPNDRVPESVVPEGTILAFGDNRAHSTDSRVIGFVSMDEVVGRADIIFWPLDKLEFIKHRY